MRMAYAMNDSNSSTISALTTMASTISTMLTTSPLPIVETGDLNQGTMIHTNFTTMSPSSTVPASNIEDVHFCKWILYEEVQKIHVRIWDWLIFTPNALFMMFLLTRHKIAVAKLRSNQSRPVMATFYILVVINVISSLLRCIVSMTVNAATPIGDVADRTLWIIVRFFLLSTEISVLVFGLAFGHLDSRTSIRRVLLVTSLISLCYSTAQGVLEFIAPDESFYISSRDFYLFAHGGTVFWTITCLISSFIYLIVFLTPWTPCRRRLPLPAKKSFYFYCFLLAFLNLLQAVGSALFNRGFLGGLCIVDTTTYLYFSMFTPLVYYVFLADFLASSTTLIMFSYKPQVDDENHLVESPRVDDIVSGPSGASVAAAGLPHEINSVSSFRTDADFLYQRGAANSPSHQLNRALTGSPRGPMWESTHFDQDIISPSTTSHSINSIE